jgi:hypothetical protein
MADANSHLIEIDGREYELEVIGDEIVVCDFRKLEVKMIRALTQPSEETGRDFMRPREPLFSFPASPELRALIFEANEYFDKHDEEASPEMCARIDELATPTVRELLRQAGGSQ